MKHTLKLAILTSLLCANAYATPVYQPPGPNLTYGSSSNNQSIMSSIANPAAAAAVLKKEDSQYRFGIFSIGGGYELGDVNDLFNKIDSTKNTLTTPISSATLQGMYLTYQTCGATPACKSAFDASIASSINTSSSTATLNNVVMPALQKDGNATLYFDGHVPLTPFVIAKKGWGGSIVLDANVSAIANISFIADPLNISIPTATAISNAVIANPANFILPTIPNDSSILVKAAVVEEIGLGYSRSLLTREVEYPAEGALATDKFSVSELRAGELTAGVRVKYYQVKLANDAQKQTQSTAGSQSTLKASKTYSSKTGIGLDVGTLWTSKHYRAGAWINNLNSPSFKYNAIDVSTYTNPAVIAQINSDGTYKMKPQLQLEAAIFSASQNWVVNTGLDANAVKDPVGRDFQWFTLSAAYATNSWWIPGARLGYRSNLAGTKLGYVTGGLTLVKALSLDIAYSSKSVTDKNGKSIPRSAMINLGLQMTF